LSDLHVGALTGRRRIREAVRLANAARADLVVMTGDYVCYSRRDVDAIRAQLEGIEAPRLIATLGNHDHWIGGDRVARALEQCGFEVLANSQARVDVRGAPLQVIGIDDPVTRQHDLDAAFRAAGEGTRVALCHGPELADEIARRGADLILSGHTHGGQIFIRGITDRIIERIGLRYVSGFYEVGAARLYVSAGVGSSSVPVRVGDGTRAEVAVHILRPGEPILPPSV